MAITKSYFWVHLFLVRLFVFGQGIKIVKLVDCPNSRWFLYWILVGKECTDGFPSNVQDVVQNEMVDKINNFNSTRLIPDMNFTCNGTIKKVTVTGIKQDGDRRPMRNMKLQIWRLETATEWGRYHRNYSIELPSSCKMNMLKVIMMFDRIGIYECTLRSNLQMSVKPGDILGIELPPKPNANLQLYSVTDSGLTNYIFERARGDLQSSTIDLCNKTNETTTLPLVRVEVKPSRPGMHVPIAT